MEPQALRTIIQTTLKPANLWSLDAEELLMATAANESHLGQYRTQIHGPARGIFQMEGATYNDINTNVIQNHKWLIDVATSLNDSHDVDQLVDDDPLAIFYGRLQYWRHSDPLPDSGDIEGIWAIYKKLYNTPQGAATHDQFIACYDKYVVNV
jgi:hypothetical protein